MLADDGKSNPANAFSVRAAICAGEKVGVLIFLVSQSSSTQKVGVPIICPEPQLGLKRPGLALTTAEYFRVMDWTGRVLTPGKRGVIAADAPAVLARIDRDPKRWALRVHSYGSGWSRVVGSAQDLVAMASRIGQRWLRGIRLAMQLE